MNWSILVRSINAETARAFVAAARHVIDALLIEGERVRRMQTPGPRDYARADLPRDTPAGGWIDDGELRDATRRLTEAIAAERWTDGLLCAFRVFALIGGGL